MKQYMGLKNSKVLMGLYFTIPGYPKDIGRLKPNIVIESNSSRPVTYENNILYVVVSLFRLNAFYAGQILQNTELVLHIPQNIIIQLIHMATSDMHISKRVTETGDISAFVKQMQWEQQQFAGVLVTLFTIQQREGKAHLLSNLGVSLQRFVQHDLETMITMIKEKDTIAPAEEVHIRNLNARLDRLIWVSWINSTINMPTGSTMELQDIARVFNVNAQTNTEVLSELISFMQEIDTYKKEGETNASTTLRVIGAEYVDTASVTASVTTSSNLVTVFGTQLSILFQMHQQVVVKVQQALLLMRYTCMMKTYAKTILDYTNVNASDQSQPRANLTQFQNLKKLLENRIATYNKVTEVMKNDITSIVQHHMNLVISFENVVENHLGRSMFYEIRNLI